MPVSWPFLYAIKQVPWQPLLELLSWYPLVLVKSLQLIWRSGDWFNIKTASYQYRQSHCGDKTILRPSSLHNRISYTGNKTSLYWIRALVSIILKWVAVTWLNSSPPSAAYMSVNWVSIASSDGLLPGRCHAITWTNAGLFSMDP